MSALGAGLIDWEHLTGQSKFVIDVVSIPIFSAIAGVLTNWTGVLMLFAPTRFTGFHVPGLKVLFPFLPRKLQILPIFAPGGILGFQGFVPARAEKMAGFISDKALVKIGSPRDFYRELDPDALAARIATAGHPLIRPMVDNLMSREHPQLWRDLPPRLKEMLFRQLEARFPEITKRAFDQIGDNIDQLVDIKLLAVGHMRRHPELLKHIFYSMGAPELRFMTKIGVLGAPMGLLLALYLQVHHDIPVVGLIPAWLVVLVGAAVIGIVVNIIAIKVVFTPGEPRPRYMWRAVYSIARRSLDTVADVAREVQAGEPITHIVDQQVTQAQSVVLHALGMDNGQAGRHPKRITSEQDLRALGTAMLKGSWPGRSRPSTSAPRRHSGSGRSGWPAGSP